MEKCDNVTIPMATTKINADLQGTPTDQTKYRSMIGGLMYLTASRPDIAFITFDSGFKLIAYSDADLAGCLDDYKSTSRGIQFLGDKIVDWSLKKQDCTSMSTAEAETEYQLAKKALPSKRFEYLDHNCIGRCNNCIVLLISKVPNTKDTNKFKLDTQDITYTMGMFRDTLHLLVETLDNPFVAPVNIEIIKSFMQIVGYQGVVDKKKDVIQYPRFTKLIIADLMKKFPSIPLRLEEDYHSIKVDILLVSVYTTGNVIVQWMLISDAFLTDEICDTYDYKEYETVFVGVEVLMNQPQSVVSTQGTHRATPIAHRTPTLTTASPQGKKRKQSAGETSSPRKLLKNIAKVQEKLDEEEIEKMVEEPESHKENLEVVDDDNKDDKKDENDKKDDDVEKTDDDAEDKDNDDHTDHTLVETHAAGSMENRNEQMQTPISSPNRSPRKY
nr:hypothetical protein [Tanacetum cinerariifolium]GEW68799.1 hypothetical protein [Tanacetum cinerariifolium]